MSQEHSDLDLTHVAVSGCPFWRRNLGQIVLGFSPFSLQGTGTVGGWGGKVRSMMKEEEGLPSTPQSQARVVVIGRTLYERRLGDKTQCTWCPTPRMEGRTFRHYFVRFPQSPAQYLARNRDTRTVMTWCPHADGLEVVNSSCPDGLRGCLFEGSPEASIGRVVRDGSALVLGACRAGAPLAGEGSWSVTPPKGGHSPHLSFLREPARNQGPWGRQGGDCASRVTAWH